MKEIFKIGDTVYHWDYGKGEITEISLKDIFPIIVNFKEQGRESFTKDGRYTLDEQPSLSFTTYDLVNGGFSQERPLPEIEVDTLVYVRNNNEWYMKYFSHFEEGKVICFLEQKKSKETKETFSWNEYSLTNPLEK